MNIFYWADGFWPRIGGTETQGMELLVEMQRRGHNCTVMAQKDAPFWSEDDEYKAIPIKRFDFNSILIKKELKNLRLIEEYLRSLAKDFRPDIIYLNALTSGSAFTFLLFQKIFDVPVIATIHAPYYDEMLPPLVHQICKQVDTLCCGSKWGAHVMEKFQFNAKVIYYGICFPNLEPSPLPFTPPVLLLLGRLVTEKGFDTGIEAFYLLKKRGITARLLIAGDGVEKSALEKLVFLRGLESDVEFTGGIAREDVYSAINRATLVLMPSHFEAFGIVALEALQMGRPVIASHVGGLPEIVDETRGRLIAPKNPEALSDAIASLLEKPDLLIEMGRQARKWAQNAFSLEDNANQYEQLFKEHICCPL